MKFKIKNYSSKIFLKKFTAIAERFSLSDFNRQIVIDFSTHATEGLARIFTFNFREFNETLGISGFSFVFLYFKVPTKTIASFTVNKSRSRKRAAKDHQDETDGTFRVSYEEGRTRVPGSDWQD